MINNDNVNKSNKDEKPKSKPIDNVRADVLAHIKIKDLGSGQVLVNKRG